jgi:hypothetical protein
MMHGQQNVNKDIFTPLTTTLGTGTQHNSDCYYEATQNIYNPACWYKNANQAHAVKDSKWWSDGEIK